MIDPANRSFPTEVQAQLRDAGFDVRFGMLHGLWHMVAELDDETSFAVSGTNPDSVANSLLQACAMSADIFESEADDALESLVFAS